MASFERAMDKEFDRLEGRAAESGDAAEKDTIAELQAQMIELDRLRARAESEGAARDALRGEMQVLMGRIISLGQAHRRQRLAGLAESVDLTDEQEISAFVEAVDRIYRETHLDWAALFNRGP